MDFKLIKDLVKFLDPHLSILILEYYEEKENCIFNPKELAQEKIMVLFKTKIIDYIRSELEKFEKNDNTTKLIKELDNQKIQIEKDASLYLANSQKFSEFVENHHAELEKEKFSKMGFLKIDNFEQMEKTNFLYIIKYARCLYDVGQYSESLRQLNMVVNLVNEDELINVLWGKTASEIILNKYTEAKDDFQYLKQKIDITRNIQQLSNRANYLHTALFLHFNSQSVEMDFESLIDLFTAENYLSVIQMICPHLMRYLLVALVLSKNYQQYGSFNLNAFLNLLQKGVCDYDDNFIQFIKYTHIHFDFPEAQNRLRLFAKEIKHDYFLNHKVDAILQNSHVILFETYCRIYKTVSIKHVANSLEFSEEDAEIWIVNLIRNANIEAKIDSEKGTIDIIKSSKNIYEQITNKTRELLPRTTLLINNIKRIMSAQKN